MDAPILILEIIGKKYSISYLKDSDFSKELSERYTSITVDIGSFVIDILNTDMEEVTKQLLDQIENAEFDNKGQASLSVAGCGSVLLLFTFLYVQSSNSAKLLTDMNSVYDLIQCAATKNRLPWGDDIKEFLELAKDSIQIRLSMRDSNVITHYCFNDVLSLLVFDFAQVIQNNLVVKRCENCKKSFIPSSRSDEIYCDNIFKNDKTCKQLGYEIKLSKDAFKSAYRVAYKTQNARVARNKQITDYKEKHLEPWVLAAKQKMKEYEKKNDIDGFKKWLEENRDNY